MGLVIDYTSGFFEAAPTGEGVGSITGNATLDLTSGNVFSHTPSSNATFVFSSPPASGISYDFTLKVTPSATVTIAWPSSVEWPSGAAPTAPANGETDVYTFFTTDNGTTYYGNQVGDAVS
jgi:hypothetical protein